MASNSEAAGSTAQLGMEAEQPEEKVGQDLEPPPVRDIWPAGLRRVLPDVPLLPPAIGKVYSFVKEEAAGGPSLGHDGTVILPWADNPPRDDEALPQEQEEKQGTGKDGGAGMAHLTICALAGSTVAEVQLEISSLVSDVKWVIFERGGPAPSVQRLVFGETVLSDHATLEASGIVGAVALQLMRVQEEVCKVKTVMRCMPKQRRPGDGDLDAFVADVDRSTLRYAASFDTLYNKDKEFNFDAVLPEECPQSSVFRATCGVVADVLEGHNCSVITFGQHGGWNAHSLLGPSWAALGPPWRVPARCEDEGLIPRAIDALFHRISLIRNRAWHVRISYFEVTAQRGMLDLLSPEPGKHEKTKKLARRGETGEEQEVWVSDGSAIAVTSAEEARLALAVGLRTRQWHKQPSADVSTTLFTIKVESQDASGQTLRGALHLVHTPGSRRRGGRALGEPPLSTYSTLQGLMAVFRAVEHNQGKQAKEGGKKQFVPYRDSKVTDLLRGAFGGRGKTLWLGHVSLDGRDEDETINTCRYGSRVGLIKNRPEAEIDHPESFFAVCGAVGP